MSVKNKRKSNRGCKGAYDPRMLPVVEKMKRECCLDKEVYDELGISHDTFYKYLREKPEFSEAYNRGKDANKTFLTELTVSATRKLLEGSEYTEETTKYIPGAPDAQGRTQPIIREKTIKKRTTEPNAYITSTLLKLGVGGLVEEPSDEDVQQIVINLHRYKQKEDEKGDDDND